MAIELRLCLCGCGKSKLGTEKLKYYSEACKQREFRKRKQVKKESGNE